MRAAPRWGWILLLAAGGCATSVPESHRASVPGGTPWDAEHAEHRTAEPDEDAMLLHALALALAPSPAGDPADAAAAFWALLERYPSTRYGPLAEVYLRGWAEREALADRAGELEAELAATKALEKVLQAEVKAREGELARMRAALAEKEAQLRRTQGELEQLKRIDLERHR